MRCLVGLGLVSVGLTSAPGCAVFPELRGEHGYNVAEAFVVEAEYADNWYGFLLSGNVCSNGEPVDMDCERAHSIAGINVGFATEGTFMDTHRSTVFNLGPTLAAGASDEAYDMWCDDFTSNEYGGVWRTGTVSVVEVNERAQTATLDVELIGLSGRVTATVCDQSTNPM